MDYKNVSPALAELSNSYQYKAPPGPLVWLQELITNILRFLKDLWSSLHIPLFHTNSDSHAIGDVMQFLLIAFGAICGLLVLFILAGRLSHISNARKMALTGTLSSDLPLDQQGWKNYAQELVQKENYRDAIRAVYMSTLYLLDEKGIMKFAQNKTNYEYLYALGTRGSIKHSLQQPFRNLVDRVESVWFGFASCDKSDYDFCLGVLTEMETTLSTGMPEKLDVLK
jgi:hypothetical protein